MATSPVSVMIFLAGCLRPLLIFAGETSSLLRMGPRRGLIITVAAGLPTSRLRFRGAEDTNASSMSDTPGELKEESEELSSLTCSSCLIATLTTFSAANAWIVAVNCDLVCRLADIGEFAAIKAVSRATREVFMSGSHGR